MKILSLAGTWTAVEVNKPFVLPGSASENKIGTPQQEFDSLTRDAVRCLRQRYNYVGTLTLTREFDVPEEFEGKHLTLFLERVNIASELWIDDVKIDRQIVEITTPHTYNLTGRLSAGKHTITLKIDNSNLLNLDSLASGYSDDTQGIWLGIIGRIELQCRDLFHISSMQIFPKESSAQLQLTINSDCSTPKDRKEIKLTIQAVSPDGTFLAPLETTAILCNRKQIVHINYPMGDNIKYWSEFTPVLYTMNATLEYGDTKNTYSERFGMRTVSVIDKQICINSRPVSLRGTLDNGIYPLTGYPPTDLETWRHTMRTVKEYGLNHVRFHAWCPPHEAFTAADELGIYITAEMPLWLNHDVCALDTGEDPIHKSYFLNEAINISRTFGNHPSFIMFSNGNELLGDFEMLEEITTMIKALDNRRLYTLTTNFEHTLAPCEDYLCAVEGSGKRVRVQVFHDIVSENTCLCYDEPVSETPVPVISFEVGQYCMYPNVDSTPDFTGNLIPCNFNAIKRDMQKNNIYKKLDRYLKASGAFSALYYKEECEAMERTHKMGGFELLGLSDHTGQCSATVGLLDVFWKSKGIVTPEKFRESCDEIVPLMKAGRFYKNTDTFISELDLYDYSENPSGDVEYTLKIYKDGICSKEISTHENQISCPLNFINEPAVLHVTLSAKGHENSWDIFVYTDSPYNEDFIAIDDISQLDEAMKCGKNIIINVTCDMLKKPFVNQFKPLFWSPAFFVSDRTCGLWCDSSHPIFKYFPTTDYANFQWRHPMDNSVSTDISSLPDDFDVIVEPITNFYENTPRSPLFEVKIGNTNVLFNGFDLSGEHITIQALKRSIYNYVSSSDFKPKYEMTIEQFKKLFK